MRDRESKRDETGRFRELTANFQVPGDFFIKTKQDQAIRETDYRRLR